MIRYEEAVLRNFLGLFTYDKAREFYRYKMMAYYAFSNTEFYRSKFKAIIEFDKNACFSSLPTINKTDMKAAFLDSTAISACYNRGSYGIYRTSTCGKNAFLYARPAGSERFSRMAACFISTGKWKIGDPWIKLTSLGCIETAEPLDKGQSSMANGGISSGGLTIPARDDFISAPKALIKDIYRKIVKSTASLIHANPNYLKMLLVAMHRQGLALEKDYTVNSTYELLLPTTKRLIEKYMRCTIYDQYGCSEIGPISISCREKKNHIFCNTVFLELVPAWRLGRSDVGMIIVTDLENKAMPFVRYFTGDYAFISPGDGCGCDYNAPFMGLIAGRDDELLCHKNSYFFPLELDAVFCGVDNILAYQIMQDEEKYLIRVMSEDPDEPINHSAIKKNFCKLVGDKGCDVAVECVPVILPSRRGKYRTVIISS